MVRWRLCGVRCFSLPGHLVPGGVECVSGVFDWLTLDCCAVCLLPSTHFFAGYSWLIRAHRGVRLRGPLRAAVRRGTGRVWAGRGRAVACPCVAVSRVAVNGVLLRASCDSRDNDTHTRDTATADTTDTLWGTLLGIPSEGATQHPSLSICYPAVITKSLSIISSLLCSTHMGTWDGVPRHITLTPNSTTWGDFVFEAGSCTLKARLLRRVASSCVVASAQWGQASRSAQS